MLRRLRLALCEALEESICVRYFRLDSKDRYHFEVNRALEKENFYEKLLVKILKEFHNKIDPNIQTTRGGMDFEHDDFELVINTFGTLSIHNQYEYDHTNKKHVKKTPTDPCTDYVFQVSKGTMTNYIDISEQMKDVFKKELAKFNFIAALIRHDRRYKTNGNDMSSELNNVLEQLKKPEGERPKIDFGDNFKFEPIVANDTVKLITPYTILYDIINKGGIVADKSVITEDYYTLTYNLKEISKFLIRCLTHKTLNKSPITDRLITGLTNNPFNKDFIIKYTALV